MALSITATVDDTTKAVRLTITGGTPDYTVTAAPGGDRLPYTVRSTYSPITGDPSGRVALDGDAPLNVPTQYVVTDKAGQQAQTAVVTPTSDVPMLSDATDPTRSLPVVVVSQPPNTWEGRSVWWDVLGQREPFVSVAPMRLRAGDLVLRTETRADRSAMVALFASGHPLVLRSVTPAAVDDVVLLPLTVTDELVMAELPQGPRLWTITYQAVSRELGPYAADPGRTYASLPLESPTYADVVARFMDYRALLSGDPYAGLGAEVLANGSFTGGLTGWGTFWTAGASIDTSQGTALVTSDAGGNGRGSIDQQPGSGANIPATGPRLLRVTGKVRSTSPGSAVTVQLYTNTLPGKPEPFAPGAAVTTATLRPGPAWATFAVDLAVPNSAHDVFSLFLRSDAMPAGAVVEWDDVSARWHT